MDDTWMLTAGRGERNVKRHGQVRASVQDQGRLSGRKDGVTDSSPGRGSGGYKGLSVSKSKTNLGNLE